MIQYKDVFVVEKDNQEKEIPLDELVTEKFENFKIKSIKYKLLFFKSFWSTVC